MQLAVTIFIYINICIEVYIYLYIYVYIHISIVPGYQHLTTLHHIFTCKYCPFSLIFSGDKGVQSPLEIVMASSRDMAVWEPFRNNVDMDLQVCLRYCKL